MSDTVTVVFRVWPDLLGGDVIALFPSVPYDNRGAIMSYQHIGQHGAADYPHVIRATWPATPAEYAPLERELRQIGYRFEVRSSVYPLPRERQVRA